MQFSKKTENTNHAPLEGTRGIGQAKRHPPIGISAEGAGECGFFPDPQEQ